LHMAQLMPLPLTVSCFSKIQIGFTFLVPAYPGSPGKRAVKLVCVCVCVCYYEQTTVSVTCYLLNDQSVMHSESADISSNYLTAYTNFTKIFHYKFPFCISKIIFSALVSSYFSILCAAINFRYVQLNSTYLLTCGSV